MLKKAHTYRCILHVCEHPGTQTWLVMYFVGVKHRQTSPNWTLFSKNFISELTYIKCIIQKISKKRVSVTLCAYFVPNFRHSRHIHKMCLLF